MNRYTKYLFFFLISCFVHLQSSYGLRKWLQYHELESFIVACEHSSLDDAKSAIYDFIQEDLGVAHGNKTLAKRFLKNLRILLHKNIHYVQAQIKHQYRYDQNTLSECVQSSAVILGLMGATLYAYQTRMAPHRKIFKEFEQYSQSLGLKVQQTREDLGDNWIRYTTKYEAPGEMGLSNFHDLCKKYEVLSKNCNDVVTLTLGLVTLYVIITDGLSFLVDLLYDSNEPESCFRRLHKTDPNAKNVYLPLYQDLLAFVVHLESEIQKYSS